ncbi:MAG: hypothetical protein A2X08_04530 [Bacteroidetes bacterium GWA2_32_17]|nr:MAG: hypothetical protein A2X08_04530 [Bacteroidetes bacterium GWA2_32_17]
MTADPQTQPFCFNFSPTALFSAKPFGYHFCKSKRGALLFIFILVCTTFAFALHLKTRFS